MTSDPYQLLGLSPDASLAEARSAYRRLAELFHPDRLEGHREEVRAEANRRMEDLNAAWVEIQQRSSDESSPAASSMGPTPVVPEGPDEGKPLIGNAEVRQAGGEPRIHLRWAGGGAQATALALRRLSQGGVVAHEVDWGAFRATLDGVDTRRLLEEVVVARHPDTIVQVLVPAQEGTLALAAAVAKLDPTEQYDLYAETFA